ncbi:MAG: hypothetical protein C0601_01715 [Candidatus Muiribacterium halophilum]|uniref:Uncharacterized protein n=1 Tax=Muiribacterium halophilum TaxID=2053465 RepID=A0A2N5ZLC6_MUIH1|nr:MAG: hypothetical protein C0601_01715 [Candidatus Muirbacterium halophilum]
MFKKSIVVLLVMLFLGNLVFANDGKADLQLLLGNVVEKNWENTAKLYQQEYDVQLNTELDNAVNTLTEELINAIKDDAKQDLDMFCEEFENLDIHSKNYVYSEVLTKVKEFDMSRDSEYLPGYGYTDTDYIYKLGKELNANFVQSYWKKEKRTIEKGKTYKFYVKMELATEVGAQLGGEAGAGMFKITGEAHFTVNGKLEKYAEVNMTTKETVNTETMLKYEKRQVFFEVWRAPKATPDAWALDGNCYLYKEFPSETEIVLEPGQVFGL